MKQVSTIGLDIAKNTFSGDGVDKLPTLTAGDKDKRVTPEARDCLLTQAAQLDLIKRQILEADRRVLAWRRNNNLSKRLEAMSDVKNATTPSL